MFDNSVVDDINLNHRDAYVTGHLEVPGEMFKLALKKQRSGQGAVGSTSDILNFILNKTKEEAEKNEKKRI
jgi:quinolinate synthase